MELLSLFPPLGSVGMVWDAEPQTPCHVMTDRHFALSRSTCPTTGDQLCLHRLSLSLELALTMEADQFQDITERRGPFQEAPQASHHLQEVCASPCASIMSDISGG